MATSKSSKMTDEDVIERVKKVLLLKGRTSSQTMNDVLTDLGLLAKPHSKALLRKNDITPFEDAHSLEFLGPKNDCGLFALASHNKKRPNNLVLGRLFEGHILDMFEFGVDNFQAIHSIAGSKKAIGSKPMVVFLGDQWQTDSLYIKIQNLLLDLFRGYKADKISLQGVDHVVTCGTADGTIFVRAYYVNYKKSDSKVPELVLKPMGPCMDLTVRRSQLASEDMWRTAIKRAKLPEQMKVKNIHESIVGDKMGRIHMKKQNLDALGGKRIKALRNGGRADKRDRSEEPVDVDVDDLADRGKRRRVNKRG